MNFVWILKFSFLQVQEQLDVLNEKLQERLKQQAEKQRAATEVKARLAEKVAHKVRQIHAESLNIHVLRNVFYRQTCGTVNMIFK